MSTSPPDEENRTDAAPPVELLDPFERVSFRALDLLQRRGVPLSEAFLKTFGNAWMWPGVKDVLRVRGLERLAGVPGDGSILLVANHRTYFDLYLASVILERRTHIHQPVFCPVRADFFYQKPLGVLVNLVGGGGRMYPPIFREPSKSDFNRWSLQRMVEMVHAGNVTIGFHPEGRRNKDSDPYSLLPAQPGVGKLVMEAWPTVIPVFLHGLSNNLLENFRNNYRRDYWVTAVFGAPVDLTPFRAMKSRLSVHKRIADHLLDEVRKLGEEDKALRAELPPSPKGADGA